MGRNYFANYVDFNNYFSPTKCRGLPPINVCRYLTEYTSMYCIGGFFFYSTTSSKTGIASRVYIYLRIGVERQCTPARGRLDQVRDLFLTEARARRAIDGEEPHANLRRNNIDGEKPHANLRRNNIDGEEPHANLRRNNMGSSEAAVSHQ